MRVFAGATLVLAGAIACVATGDPKKASPARQHASPNASILPAPLAPASELTSPEPHRSAPDANTADSAGRMPGRDLPPPPPEPIPLAKPLSADSLPTRDIQGYSLEAEFRWSDVPGPPNVPESSGAATRDATQKTILRVSVDLANLGRMRLVLESPAFPIAERSELRARRGYYGHTLVWPDGLSYRNVLPGALRALFQEQRLDVSPLLRARLTPGIGGTKLSHKTTVTAVDTSLGSLLLEQATTQVVGFGGELLCRLLVELVGAEPSTEACRPERIPVSAQYRWSSSGGLAFVVTALVEKKELPGMMLAVPPEGARFSPGELPLPASAAILPPDVLSRLRTRPSPTSGARSSDATNAPITAENRTSLLQYLLLDGIPVGRLRPNAHELFTGPLRGRYTVSWRDFFGAQVAPPELLELPASVRLGARDGDGGR